MSLLQKPKFLDDLQVYGFGKNGFHQTKPGYGDFVVPAARSAPVGIPGGVVDVAAGFDFSVALTTTGKVYAWGNDGQGQSSGNSCPSAPCEVSSPLLVTFPSTIGMKSIAAGPKHSLALSHSGLVFGWGFNNFYELGSGSPGSTIPPSQIASSAIYTSITAGLRLSMAIDTNGNPWAWGMSTATCNAAGYMDPTRLNTGAFASEFIISVKAAQDVEAVTFITASGKLIVCGDNTRYQLGVPSMSVGPGTFVAIDVSSVFIDAAIGTGWGIAIKRTRITICFLSFYLLWLTS
jgi:alpha-tubulin suppressor-like RCC1 family protein